MPKPDASLSAVVVSGGKQYRVAPGDRILVDRLSAEPGSSIKLGRLVLFSEGGDLKVGSALEGLEVEARVLAHRRGPRTESIRYKSKKRVRVHRGGRSYLTALEIVAVGGIGLEEPEAEKATEESGGRGRKESASRGGASAGPKRGRAKAAPRRKKAEAPKAEALEAEAPADAGRAQGASEKKPVRRRTKKEETE